MSEYPTILCPEYHVALSAAKTGALELIERFGKRVEVQQKGIANYVSEADLATEAAVINTIRTAYPDHAILSEESYQSIASDAEHLWIIDPLDGTNNFLHNIPHFAISIAYYYRGEPRAGVVLNPISNDLFSVAKGEGAWHGNRRQSVSSERRLDDIVLACGFYYDRDRMMQATLDTLADFFKANVHGMRRFGAAALDLCHVGCGQYGLFFEYRLSPWDYAAGQLFVTEAGGLCTDCSNRTLPITTGSSICATNGHVHDAALAIIRHHWK